MGEFADSSIGDKGPGGLRQRRQQGDASEHQMGRHKLQAPGWERRVSSPRGAPAPVAVVTGHSAGWNTTCWDLVSREKCSNKLCRKTRCL